MLSNFIKHQRFPLKTASFTDWVKLLLALTMKKTKKCPKLRAKATAGRPANMVVQVLTCAPYDRSRRSDATHRTR